MLNQRRGWTDSLEPALVQQRRRPGRRSTRCRTAVVDVAARLAALPAGQGPPARPHRRRCPGGTSSRRSAAPRAVRRGPRPPPRCATRSPPTRPAWPGWWTGPSPRRGSTPSPAPARSAAPTAWASQGEVSRVLLNFDGSLRQRADAGPRARPRLPQHQPRPSHAAAAPDADGAGRDGVASSARRSWSQAGLAAAGDDAGGRLALLDVDLSGRRPGRRRHPLPLPVRAGPVRRAGRRRRCRSTELRELMLEAQADAYGDGLDPSLAPPGHVGGQGPLLHRLLQLPVHVRPAVRPRPLRRVPARPGPLPPRLRRPAVGHRPRRGRRAGRPLRHRRRTTPASGPASLAVIRARIDEYESLAAGT